MNTPPVKVLIVEDEPPHARAISRSLAQAVPPIQAHVVGTLGEFARAAERFAPDLVLLDLILPDGRAESLLTSPPESGALPIVVMTSHGDEKLAVASIQRGAMDYVVKSPAVFADMGHIVDRALQAWRLRIERKQLEEELRASEQQYRLLFAANPNPMWVYDDTTLGFLAVNERAVQHYGWSAAEFLTMTVRDICPGAQSPETRITLLENGGPQEGKLDPSVHRRKDGTLRSMEVSASSIQFKGRRAMLCSMVDITERTQTQEALRASEERFRTYVEQAADAVVVHDLSGRFLEVNKRACDSLGYSRGELLRMRVSDVDAEFDETWAQMPWETHRPGEAIVLERRHRRKDGSIFPVEIHFGCFEMQGTRRFLALVRDVTERKRAQEELARMSQLLSKAQKVAHVGSFEYVVDTQTTIWSEEEYRIYGLDPSGPSPTYEAMLANHIHPDDAALLNERFGTALRQGAIYELEHRIVRPDGTVRVVYERAVPHFDETGKLTRYCGATLDITDRQQAEDKIRHQGSLIRSLLDSIPDLVFYKDLHGVYLGCNPAFAELVGRPREEIVGRTDHELFAPEVAEAFRKHDQTVLESLTPRHDEEWVTHPNGRRRLVDTLKTPYRGPAGELLGILGISRDITEHHEAEQSLAHLHRQNELILLSAAEGILGLDLQDRHTFVNPAAAAMLGYTIEELLALPAHATWHHSCPDGSPYPLETCLIRTTFDGKAVEHMSTDVFWRKDGSSFPVEYASRPIVEQGKVAGAVVTFSDISQRRRQEEMDRLQFQVLHQLATGAPLGDVLVSIVNVLELGRADWRGSVMLVDETRSRLVWGAAPKLPRFYVEALDGLLIAPTAGSCGAAVATKQIVLVEDIETHSYWTKFRHLAHQAGLRACWSLPVLSADGEPFGVLAVYCSKPCLPTEEEFRWVENVLRLASIAIGQRRAEESLRKSEAKLEAAQGLANLGSWHLALNPYHLSWSTETCRIFDRTSAPTTPEEFAACIHPDDRALVNRAWQDLSNGVSFDLEHRILAGRKTKWVRQIAALDKVTPGKPVKCIGTFLDITRLKETEGALRQAQKLEGIGQLAGGVAHDFNNILAAVMMQLNLLQMHPSLDREARDGLREMEEEARRAASLTRQLLMFSRRAVMDVKPLDLDEVVENLLKMLRRLIGEHINLELGNRASLPLVEADAGMLEQVLMNLVVNARDAMPQGGKITISTRVASFSPAEAQPGSSRRPGQFVCLAVSDTGCGMDTETLARIFEPFFTTKEAGRGTGLGLATVHGIVTQHKGWVEVDSAVGNGTTFAVYLPTLARSERELPVPQEKLRARNGKETILVVEDQVRVRQLVALALRTLGYTVYEAENGRDAIKLWQKLDSEIDLLLTDMVMPEGMTGLELTEQLRAVKPGLKAIISSGYSAEIAQMSAIDKAGVVYLPKPYEVQVLADAVRTCLDQGAKIAR